MIRVPADYEKIREENIARYGWDTAVLDLLGQLYSERTHFIFELIQNAEDAGRDRAGLRALRGPAGAAARRTPIHRGGRPRRLRGRPEREGRGPHRDREVRHRLQVGVRVHQDPRASTAAAEHFGSRATSGRSRWRRCRCLRPERSSCFPSITTPVPAATAVREIAAALNALQPRVLLFLRNIGRLRVGGAGAARVGHLAVGHRGRLAAACPGVQGPRPPGRGVAGLALAGRGSRGLQRSRDRVPARGRPDRAGFPIRR